MVAPPAAVVAAALPARAAAPALAAAPPKTLLTPFATNIVPAAPAIPPTTPLIAEAVFVFESPCTNPLALKNPSGNLSNCAFNAAAAVAADSNPAIIGSVPRSVNEVIEVASFICAFNGLSGLNGISAKEPSGLPAAMFISIGSIIDL